MKIIEHCTECTLTTAGHDFDCPFYKPVITNKEAEKWKDDIKKFRHEFHNDMEKRIKRLHRS